MGKILFTFCFQSPYSLHVLFVSHRYLQKCVLCLCWELKTSLDMFRPISFLEKFPTFWKSSQLFVSTLFPPPCRRTAWRHYSPFPNFKQSKYSFVPFEKLKYIAYKTSPNRICNKKKFVAMAKS
jgi:hypothetical protein